MANKYHVNPTTLEPGRCRANKSCPFGDESVHFPTLEEARLAGENRLAQVMDTFSSKGDFEVNEVVILGDFYDTPGREATVVEVEKDSVKFKSYDDGETYWVPKEFLTDPRAAMYVSRKDSLGNFVTQDKAYELQALENVNKLTEEFKQLSEAERVELDELWSNDGLDSETVRGQAYALAAQHKRARAVEKSWNAVSAPANDSRNFGANEAIKNAMLAELVQDKISPEDYYTLAAPVLRSSSKLKKLID